MLSLPRIGVLVCRGLTTKPLGMKRVAETCRNRAVSAPVFLQPTGSVTRLREQTVAPVFGQIKHIRGFR